MTYSHLIGFDDAPFERSHRGDVLIIGAVYSGNTLEGVLSAKVRRDGANATRMLIETVRNSKFRAHVQAILLQGIAFAGFNVIDIRAVHEALHMPVVVVARRKPNLTAIRAALLDHVKGGQRKWALIDAAGLMESCAGVYVQRAGISLGETKKLIQRTATNGALPEPLRTAHLIAGGVTVGESRHRA